MGQVNRTVSQTENPSSYFKQKQSKSDKRVVRQNFVFPCSYFFSFVTECLVGCSWKWGVRHLEGRLDGSWQPLMDLICFESVRNTERYLDWPNLEKGSRRRLLARQKNHSTTRWREPRACCILQGSRPSQASRLHATDAQLAGASALWLGKCHEKSDRDRQTPTLTLDPMHPMDGLIVDGVITVHFVSQ